MFRTIVFLAGLLSARATELTDAANPEFSKEVGEGDWDKKDQLAACAIHGGEAVDNLFDAATYILASVERCEDKTEQVRCVVDVASAISSVNEVVNVVIKAVSECGAFDAYKARCGMQVGAFTRAVGELTSASAKIATQCHDGYGAPITTDKGAALATKGFSIGLGKCIINVKDSVKSLFNVIARLMTIKTNCDYGHPEYCAHNAMTVVAAFAGIAEYVAGSIAHCNPTADSAIPAACTKASFELIRSTDNVAGTAGAMAYECKPTEAERLFLEGKVSAPSNSNGLVTFGLVALLPITAVLSFVGGSRLAKARATFTRDAESGSLIELSGQE
jgi:hypothetical protein